MADIWSNRRRIKQIEEDAISLGKHSWGLQYVVDHNEPFQESYLEIERRLELSMAKSTNDPNGNMTGYSADRI